MMLEVVRVPLLIPTFRQNLKHNVCNEIALHTRRSVLFGFLNSVMKEISSSCDHKLCFFVLIALISLTLKFYLLFRVNFLYWGEIFPSLRVNLSRVNFKYLN